jgi:hypothetical protein
MVVGAEMAVAEALWLDAPEPPFVIEVITHPDHR